MPRKRRTWHASSIDCVPQAIRAHVSKGYLPCNDGEDSSSTAFPSCLEAPSLGTSFARYYPHLVLCHTLSQCSGAQVGVR